MLCRRPVFSIVIKESKTSTRFIFRSLAIWFSVAVLWLFKYSRILSLFSFFAMLVTIIGVLLVCLLFVCLVRLRRASSGVDFFYSLPTLSLYRICFRLCSLSALRSQRTFFRIHG